MKEKVKLKEVEKKEKHRCVNCNSLFGYLRIKDKIWVCRSCGHMDEEIII